jgi:hypothetical protein
MSGATQDGETSAAPIILLAMNQYGSFRQSIDYLGKDATLLAQSANLEMIFRTKAAYCDRVRIEKRRGVFGRVDALLSELDTVKREIRDSTLPRTTRAAQGFSKATTERLLDWEKSANKLFEKLDHDDTRACIASGFLEELEGLSTTAPWAKSLSENSFRTMLATSDPEAAGEIEGAASKYSATVKSMRKYYENILKQYLPKST